MKKGISLIVLVITIIVIIILVSSVILSLSNNNPIKQATEATFKASLSEYNSELSMYIGSQYTATNGSFLPDNLNATTPASVKAIVTSMTDVDAKNYIISKGKLVYNGSSADEINWAKNVNVSLDLPYVKSGLLLWYDGVYNGGLGIHNDGTSANKDIWKDLSGNNNDGQLVNFNHTSNGWLSNGLKFTTLTDFVRMVPINTPYRTVEIVFERNEVTTGQTVMVANYENGGLGIELSNDKIGNEIYITGTGYTGAFNSTSSVIDKRYYASATYDGTSLKGYVQGINFNTLNISGVIGVAGANTIYVLNGNPSGINVQASSLRQTVYSVRIYDRALTPAEVAQNYAIDKARFGLE